MVSLRYIMFMLRGNEKKKGKRLIGDGNSGEMEGSIGVG